MGAGGQVVFDFDGALQLARDLHALADDLIARRENRRVNAETARDKWLGPLRSDFDNRESDEYGEVASIASQLRSEAVLWAKAWQGAVLQQRKNYRMAKIEEVSANRGALEKLNDTINPFARDNSADNVPEAEAPPLPTAPHFSDGGIDPRANPYT